MTSAFSWQNSISLCLASFSIPHSICQQICKTQQWPQDWKRSVFITIPKKGNVKECSNYSQLLSFHMLGNAQNSPSQASVVHEPRTSLCTSCAVCLVAQSCLTLCDLMDYSLSVSSIHGIFQARVLELVAITVPRVSSQPRD